MENDTCVICLDTIPSIPSVPSNNSDPPAAIVSSNFATITEQTKNTLKTGDREIIILSCCKKGIHAKCLRESFQHQEKCPHCRHNYEGILNVIEVNRIPRQPEPFDISIIFGNIGSPMFQWLPPQTTQQMDDTTNPTFPANLMDLLQPTQANRIHEIDNMNMITLFGIFMLSSI